MAIIGLNAAGLVGYILFYSTVNGGFAPQNTAIETSSTFTSIQPNDYEAETSFSRFNTPTALSHADSEEISENSVSPPYSVVEYDSAKQKTFEELQSKNDYSYEPPLQSEKNFDNTNEIYISNQGYQQSTNETENFPSTQAITESIPQAVTVYEPQAENPAIAENPSASESDIQSQIPAGETVWLSATGDCYHRINNCGNMNPNKAREVSLEEALSRNYKKCHNFY